MRELTQVRDAVIGALERAGLPALAAFPDRRAGRCPEAVAAVAVGAAEGRSLGFCNYLGEAWDADTGAAREVYGKTLEAVIQVDVRAETAAACEAGCATAAEVLLGGLPGGIRAGELRWEALRWERETETFLRRGGLQCSAVFVARAAEDGPAFLDFILKGVMQ